MATALRYTRPLFFFVSLLFLGKPLAHGDDVPTLTGDVAPPPSAQNCLWYKSPSTKWYEGLPVGNGRVGAIIYGGTAREDLALNETSLWTGGPTDGNYNPKEGAQAFAQVQSLLISGDWAQSWALANADLLSPKVDYGTNVPGGDMILDQDNIAGPVEGYRRDLDISKALATTVFIANGVHYQRQVLASHPAGVVVMRLTADRPGSIGFTLSYKPSYPFSATHAQGSDTLVVTGHAYGPKAEPNHGVAFQITFHAVAENGQVSSTDGALKVSGANSVTLFIAFNTDYHGRDPAALCQEQTEKALAQTWDQLLAAHEKDYRKYFDRVALDLGGAAAAQKPTDERLAALRNHGVDPDLEALFFKYGRYLLISGSREDSPLPMHLQGIWNDDRAANMGWTCDYHLDINTQQNYWPTDSCNLAECGEPLFKFVESLQAPGHRAAQMVYGIKHGWVAFCYTNAWGAIPTGATSYAFNVAGGGWIGTHLWQHYLFSGDKDFLAKRAYPVLKGLAEFYQDFCALDPKSGYLVDGPSSSPERGFFGPMPTIDRAFIYEIDDACIQASSILNIDADFRNQLKTAQAKLPPYIIGKNGQLMEWMFYDDGGETTHRHMSHLVAVFPLNHISPEKTPALAAAAQKSIELRMDRKKWERNEWSLSNVVNFYARLLQGDKAEKNLHDVIGHFTSADLLTLCPHGGGGIFCIDGNMASTAGVAEMLLQSQNGELDLLPALPGAWPHGSVRGLCGRGGFQVDETWQGGKLVSATIKSLLGGPCRVQSGNKTVQIATVAGSSYHLDAGLNRIDTK